MKYRQHRTTDRVALLAWPLAGALLLGGCASIEPAAPRDTTTGTATADEAQLRKLTDDLFSAGQPAPSQWTSIRERGVTTVINLRPDAEMDGRDEAAEVAAAGMAYRQIGIAGPGDITDANAARVQALIDEAPGPVLLHCASGNRAGALLAVIAARNGTPVEEALELGRRAGMTSMEKPACSLLMSAESETC